MKIRYIHKLHIVFIKGEKEKESCLFLGDFPKPQERQDRFVGFLKSPNSQMLRWALRAPSSLTLTVCMTSQGQPWVSSVVRKTRTQIAQDPSLNFEYTPVMGMKSFIQASLNLLFGKNSQVIMENRVRSRALSLLTETQGAEIGDRGCTIINLKETLEGPLEAQGVPTLVTGGQSQDQDPKPGLLHQPTRSCASSFKKGMI